MILLEPTDPPTTTLEVVAALADPRVALFSEIQISVLISLDGKEHRLPFSIASIVADEDKNVITINGCGCREFEADELGDTADAVRAYVNIAQIALNEATGILDKE